MSTADSTTELPTEDDAAAPAAERDDSVAVSVVVPVRDEAENIIPLLEEIHDALGESHAFEVIYVDDGSQDATADVLDSAAERFPRLRRIRHSTSCGQSAAVRSGVLAARGGIIVTLDGDGQNDPSDIPAMLEPLLEANAAPAMVAGQRRKRRDVLAKRVASRVANAIRGRLLRDGTRDTGCGLKAFHRQAFLLLPYFDHMHRFLPALMRREGLTVHLVDVNHRPREQGQSKYGNWGRAWAGVIDMLGVLWLQHRRRRIPEMTER